MLLDEDDSILVEAPTYPGALAFLKPLGCDLVPVETDGEGIIPASLRKLLDDWDASLQGRKPKCLYTCPTGCNPTGATISEERRREIYAIARDHDFLILEDDPYHFLQYQDPSDPAQQARVAAGNPFRVPSFLQIENRWLQEENGNGAGAGADGGEGGGEGEGEGGASDTARVLRFDSLSKILSSGVRIGFATGPAPLIERLELHTQATQLHTSGVSQLLVASLIKEWGLEGFNDHTVAVSDLYRERRDVFLESAERHLTGLATWTTPTAGMFVWLECLGVEETDTLIREKALKKKVLMLPGSVFMPDGSPSK